VEEYLVHNGYFVQHNVDTIHNIGDATTAIPLWIAFVLVSRNPTRKFTYGLGRGKIWRDWLSF
jgi:hypothetical protein